MSGRGADFSQGYVRRLVDDRLDRLLPELPALHLDGAKAVGKTAIALQRARTVWSLQLPEPRRIVADQVDAVLSGQPPILVDEWQRVPEVWDVIRTSVDDDCRGVDSC